MNNEEKIEELTKAVGCLGRAGEKMSDGFIALSARVDELQEKIEKLNRVDFPTIFGISRTANDVERLKKRIVPIDRRLYELCQEVGEATKLSADGFINVHQRLELLESYISSSPEGK